MAFFIPAYIQKRLLRYALSRVRLFDTDALDLDRLDIGLGRRTNIELRQVPLRKTELAAILQLPSTFTILEADVSSLRLVIPADVYASPITVHLKGASIGLVLDDARQSSRSATAHNRTEHQAQGAEPTSNNSTSPGSATSDSPQDPLIPRPEDLAKSFLQQEPTSDTAQLRAELSVHSSDLEQSRVTSAEEEDSSGYGTGGSAILPGFLAGFFAGVADRLEVLIEDVEVRLGMDIDLPSPQAGVEQFQVPLELVCFFEKLDIQGVTAAIENPGDSPHPARDSQENKPGKRLVTIDGLRTYVKMNANHVAALCGGDTGDVNHNDHSTNWSRSLPSSEKHYYPRSSENDGGLRTPTRPSPHKRSIPPSSENSLLSRLENSPVLAEDSYTSIDTGHMADVETDYDTSSESERDRRQPFLNQTEGATATSSVSDSIHGALESLRHERVPLDRRRLRRRVSPNTSPRPSSSSHRSSSRQNGVEPSGPIMDLTGVESATTPTVSTPSIEQDNHSGIYDEEASMNESKVFSHDEAASIYMSVIDDAAQEGRACTTASNMPGAWTDVKAQDYVRPLTEAQKRAVSPSSSSRPSLQEPPNSSTPPSPSTKERSPGYEENVRRSSTGQNSQQTAETMSQIRQEREKHFVEWTLLEATQLRIWLPSLIPDVEEPDAKYDMGDAENHTPANDTTTNQSLQHSRYGIPGAFSTYAESALLARSQVATGDKLPWPNPVADHFNEDEHAKRLDLELDVLYMSTVASLSDIPVMLRIIKKIQHIFPTSSSSAKPKQDSLKMLETQSRFSRVALHAHISSFAAIVSLQREKYRSPYTPVQSQSHPPSISSETILSCHLHDVSFDTFIENVLQSADLKIRSFELDIAGQQAVRFGLQSSMQSSMRPAQQLLNHDFVLKYLKRSRAPELNVTTLPLVLHLDATRLDEALVSVGGFSAVLEMGSSILSDPPSEVKIKPELHTRPRVRFEQTQTSVTKPEQNHESSLKINLRLNGSSLILRAGDKDVHLDTTAIKAVIRPGGVGLQIDDCRLFGPLSAKQKDNAAASLRARNLGVKYFARPEEQDLTRLISLVTPSKDNFERGDGGILVETLVRQRKDGAAVRASLSELSIEISSMAAIETCTQFAEDVSRLGAITKYLPEETRPGLLSLVYIGAIKLHVLEAPFIGDVRCCLSDFEIANISAPSLFALSIKNISVVRAPEQELIHAALPQEFSEHDIMLMVRLVGDELVPELEVKMMNTCIEYDVAVLLEMFRVQDGPRGVDAITASLLSLQGDRDAVRVAAREASPAAGRTASNSSMTSLKVDMGIKNSTIGLTPRGLSSKGLVVVTNAGLKYHRDKKDFSTIDLDIHKAALLLIDDRNTLADLGHTENEARVKMGQQIPLLCQQGYVSVCWVSAAHVTVFIQYGSGQENMIDVEFDDELFVLETCADSTATLSQLLSALQPPARPSEGSRYRTEIATVEDMMASFTGETFPTNPTLERHASQLEIQYRDNPENASRLYETSVDEYHQSELLDFNQDFLGDRTRLQDVDSTAGPDSVEGLNPTSLPQQAHATATKWNSDRNRYVQVSQSEALASPFKLRVKNMHIIWNLHDGYDWQQTRNAIAKAVQDIESRSEEKRNRQRHRYEEEEESEPVIGDFLFNSIYVGVPANNDPKDLTRQINRNVDDLISDTASHATTATDATPRPYRPSKPRKRLKLQRSQRHKMTFELSGVAADMFIYSPEQETVSSTNVKIRDFEIFDHVPTSTWKKFATYMQDAGVREEKKPMVHLEICNVKPIPTLLASELVIRATVLPVRLHVDQDALDFMTRFFAFNDTEANGDTNSSGDQPYIQRVEVLPVPIKLDYKPKKVDYAGLRSGRTKEFMNFFSLDGADMVLKHAIIYGCTSFARLHSNLEDIWMPDITTRQLPTVLSGLNGVRTLVNVGGGFRNLVNIPIQEYKKDGRVVRSISKGALSFARTSSSELTKFGARLAVGAQTALQGAEQFLVNPRQSDGVDWETADLNEDEKRAFSHYADQPAGLLSGLKGAAKSLERDLLMTRDVIVAVSGEARESGSLEGAAKAVGRHAPTIILRPMIGASKAVSQTLMGATNTFDPQNKRRVEDKYKRY